MYYSRSSTIIDRYVHTCVATACLCGSEDGISRRREGPGRCGCSRPRTSDKAGKTDKAFERVARAIRAGKTVAMVWDFTADASGIAAHRRENWLNWVVDETLRNRRYFYQQ